jgi:hypothetical protein
MDGLSNGRQSEGIDGFGALVASGKVVKIGREGIRNQVCVRVDGVGALVAWRVCARARAAVYLT